MFNHVGHNFPKLLREEVEGTRRYVTPTGEKYASVTTVLAEHGKEGIMEWRKRVGEAKANQISRTATTRGTGVHAAIEKYLNNEDMTDHQMMPNVKTLFVRMKEELKKIDNIHCLETGMFSHKLKLAGTVDCIAEHNGVLSVIDFKTSIRLKKKEHIGSYFMQCAAYADMFTEMTSIPITQVIVLIGVDTANFCQTLKISGDELNIHRNNLQTYIDKYYAKVAPIDSELLV